MEHVEDYFKHSKTMAIKVLTVDLLTVKYSIFIIIYT